MRRGRQVALRWQRDRIRRPAPEPGGERGVARGGAGRGAAAVGAEVAVVGLVRLVLAQDRLAAGRAEHRGARACAARPGEGAGAGGPNAAGAPCRALRASLPLPSSPRTALADILALGSSQMQACCQRGSASLSQRHACGAEQLRTAHAMARAAAAGRGRASAPAAHTCGGRAARLAQAIGRTGAWLRGTQPAWAPAACGPRPS